MSSPSLKLHVSGASAALPPPVIEVGGFRYFLDPSVVSAFLQSSNLVTQDRQLFDFAKSPLVRADVKAYASLEKEDMDMQMELPKKVKKAAGPLASLAKEDMLDVLPKKAAALSPPPLMRADENAYASIKPEDMLKVLPKNAEALSLPPLVRADLNGYASIKPKDRLNVLPENDASLLPLPLIRQDGHNGYDEPIGFEQPRRNSGEYARPADLDLLPLELELPSSNLPLLKRPIDFVPLPALTVIEEE